MRVRIRIRTAFLVCMLPSALALGGCRKMANVTDAPALKEIRVAEYELVEDLFVYRSTDFPVPLVIIPAGCSSAMPSTVDSYLESPDGWMHGSEYKKQWGKWHGTPWDIAGVLSKGTHLRIAKVTRRESRTLGMILSVLVSVDAEQFEGCLLYGGRLFRGGVCGEWDLTPISVYLKRVEG
jgi:hypothetical protein